MEDSKAELRWGVEQRLEFIEFRLFWEGRVNRSDLMDQFGVSVNQASADLNRYIGLAPDNMVHDKSALISWISRDNPSLAALIDKNRNNQAVNGNLPGAVLAVAAGHMPSCDSFVMFLSNIVQQALSILDGRTYKNLKRSN